MAYSLTLADRLRDCLDRYPHIIEKKMFGGLIFLLNGRMLIGIWKHSLIVRLGDEHTAQALQCKHVKPFEITGKRLKKWVMIHEDHLDDDVDLKRWLNQAMEFVSTLPAK